jgi:bacteriorhodopsin
VKDGILCVCNVWHPNIDLTVNFVYYGYTVIFDINNLLIVLSEHFLHLSSIPFRLNLVFEDSRVFLYEYY